MRDIKDELVQVLENKDNSATDVVDSGLEQDEEEPKPVKKKLKLKRPMQEDLTGTEDESATMPFNAMGMY